ncbi:MAG: ribonuclease HII [Fermentimonas sp.]
MLKRCMQPGCIEVGCDEAGRGCLAGPVFAAAVILPDNLIIEGLNDSKQISEKNRYKLREIIEEKALSFSVASCSPQEIDEMNILWASVEAMHRAIAGLKILPSHILVDGNRFKPYKGIPFDLVVGGDAEYQSIAAASILAKTYRDDYMVMLHQRYPEYGWKSNKGYPTKAHKEAIINFGITEQHRKSFNLIDQQLDINF